MHVGVVCPYASDQDPCCNVVLCACGVHAGLVLMYESGIVVLDLADTAVGWPSDSDDNSPQQECRCESPLLVQPVAETGHSNQRLHACVRHSLSACASVLNCLPETGTWDHSICLLLKLHAQQHKTCWSVTAVHREMQLVESTAVLHIAQQYVLHIFRLCFGLFLRLFFRLLVRLFPSHGGWPCDRGLC